MLLIVVISWFLWPRCLGESGYGALQNLRCAMTFVGGVYFFVSEAGLLPSPILIIAVGGRVFTFEVLTATVEAYCCIASNQHVSLEYLVFDVEDRVSGSRGTERRRPILLPRTIY